ncbi:MAG: C69 family dipeptidase [Kiritimatiellae bacterium]|nr:C69 family dipeptidase [Kiritimatiellia bacterium]
MIRVALCLLFAVACVRAQACTAVLVGKKASSTGRVVFGHNEDDNGAMIVRHGYVPPRSWPEGAVMPDYADCAKVPRAARTLGFFWTEVRTTKCGVPTAVAFVNEKGVAIASDNAGPTKEDTPLDRRLTDGGVCFALRLAVAERATSAREAVRIIGELVERWGYRPAGRTYVVADADEGWMVQVVSGRRWVACRCPDEAIAVMPNHYTIHAVPPKPSDDCLFSPDLVSYAVARGWWPAEKPFDFAAAYQDPSWVKIAHNTRRQQFVTSLLLRQADYRDETYPFSVPCAAKVSPEDVLDALSRHPSDGRSAAHAAAFDETPSACRLGTVESFVCVFAPRAEDTVLHVAGNRPCETGYRVFSPLKPPLPKAFDDGDAAGRLDRFFEPEVAIDQGRGDN